MKLSLTLTARLFAFISAVVFMGSGAIHAQLVGGQPAARPGGAIIGQPPMGHSGTSPTTPNYPATGSTAGTDPVRDKLNRANREAADVDRDGRISPEEASRLPPGTPLTPR